MGRFLKPAGSSCRFSNRGTDARDWFSAATPAPAELRRAAAWLTEWPCQSPPSMPTMIVLTVRAPMSAISLKRQKRGETRVALS